MSLFGSSITSATNTPAAKKKYAYKKHDRSGYKVLPRIIEQSLPTTPGWYWLCKPLRKSAKAHFQRD